MSKPDGFDAAAFRADVRAALWRAVDRLPAVRSATLAGSFATGSGLDGFSDIDTIVIADQLDGDRFARIQAVFRQELEPVVAAVGWALRLNCTLGPLKFDDPQTAVLHLMCYSCAGHREHVVSSPFTCLDWQRSSAWRCAPMAAVYPVFGLQPRHFFGARRSARDYLADLEAGVVSYRQLDFSSGYRETKHGKPMTVRDRHEFAYHIFRFLMQNVLKLLRQENRVDEGEELLAAYGAVFPRGMTAHGDLYRRLARMKRQRDFAAPVSDLVAHTTAFVTDFEAQFRDQFEHRASRQVWLRHAPTAANHGRGRSAVFQGRSDLPLEPLVSANLAAAVAALPPGPVACWASPLTRARATARAVLAAAGREVAVVTSDDLLEIDYGACEGRVASQALAEQPALVAAWQRGEDPPFPGGESSGDVRRRLLAFLARETTTGLVVSHNVVLRELVGHHLGVPPAQRHRLRIPHLAPIGVVHTPCSGTFIDLDPATERAIFTDFFDPDPESP